MQDVTRPLRYAMRYYADEPAVVDGETRLTFREFGDRVHRLSAGLRSSGVGRGTRIATLLSNSYRYLELHYAIPGAGAVIVPLNSRLALAEMEYILADAGVTHLVVDDAHARLAEKLEPLVHHIIRGTADYEALIASHRSEALPKPAAEADAAGIYYTGGTTGPAKGAVLSHRALIAQSLALSRAMDFQEHDRMLFVFPLFHLGAIAAIYALPWLGATAVFQPQVDPGEILHVIEKEQISISGIVPTVINALLNHPDARTTDVSSLRILVHAAAPISPTLCREAVETFRCRVMQAYGMTEVAGAATALIDEQDLLDLPQIRSAGRPMAGYEVEVRRADGSVAEVGEPGEIVLRGPSMLTRYWNKPEETAQALRGGWYWSGDVGYQDAAGYLYLVDRAKDMIVTGGENVYSVEVENAISAHPGVLEVAVFGVPDDKWGERVHAVVVPREGTTPTTAELIAFCRERIAGYKTPKSVELRLEPLPKSAVGKTLKRDLRAAHWAGHERLIG